MLLNDALASMLCAGGLEDNALVNDMRQSGKLFLLEVCCGESSLLTQETQRVGLKAERASLFNGYDLTDPVAVRRLVLLIRRERPLNVWISTECSAFSPLQNLNQRSPEQKADLARKQREARKQHLGGLVVAYAAHQCGSHVHWEWSRRCRAWKWPHMDLLRERLNMRTAIVGGCRAGLQDPNSGGVIGKEWRIESTSHALAKGIHLPCLKGECPGRHVPCEGSLTRRTAFYTPKMAKRVVHYMRSPEIEPRSPEPSQHCDCKNFVEKGFQHTCPYCILNWTQDSPQTEQAWVQAEAPPFSEEERKKWLHKIHLLHGATGHGSKQQLREVLQRKQVDPRIINLVDEHRCSVCEERKRPAPRRAANLEVHPGRWRVVLADGAHWVHPRTKLRNVIGLYMDQNSRFLVGKVLVEHKTHLPNAEVHVKFFQEHWQQYFGRPELLRYDAEGTWRSKALDQAFSQLNISLDPIPGDAHWHLSPLERCIGWLKECLSCLVGQDPQLSTQGALAAAIEAWNNRECVRGFSPRQHVLGQVPDPGGHLFETEIRGFPVSLMGNPEGEVAQATRLRGEAEATFARWQAKEKIGRALNSKHRKIPEFAPGDLVYYWRSQLYGKYAGGTRIQTGSAAGYAGPAQGFCGTASLRIGEGGGVA